jgi:hypothetical protein
LTSEELISNWYENWERRTIGRERGFPLKRIGNRIARTLGEKPINRLRCYYSDDQGQSWQEARITEAGPLATAKFLAGPLFEEKDGTVVASLYGYQSAEDLDVHLYTAALFRSRDGGESWGDWSLIAYDEGRHFNHSETALEVLPDNTWVAFLRSESITEVPYSLITKRTVSTDRGRTWSYPEPSAAAGVYGSVLLPDGGLAVAAQNTCCWGVTISYDYGRTWRQVLPATYAPTRAGVLDANTFWIYDQHGQIVSIYRRD